MARMGTTALNAAVNAVTNLATFGGLNTGDPGTTGANEYSGVTRQASTWNAAANGAATNASTENYTTSGATAVTFFSQWSASTGGNYIFGGALGSSVTAASITFAAGSKTLTAS